MRIDVNRPEAANKLTRDRSCEECYEGFREKGEGFLGKVVEKVLGKPPSRPKLSNEPKDYGRPPGSPCGMNGKTSDQIEFFKTCEETLPLPGSDDYHTDDLSDRLRAAKNKTESCFNTAVKKYIEEAIMQVEAAASRGWHHAAVRLEHADDRIKNEVVEYLKTHGYKVDSAAPQCLTLYW